jgi:hypothetical protein
LAGPMHTNSAVERLPSSDLLTTHPSSAGTAA